MSYTKQHYADTEAVGGGLHLLRDELNCENVGVSVLDCEPGWSGKPHDHSDDGQEEVYVLVDGEATVTVDGDDVAMSAGDALRIEPDAKREIRNGETESQFVLVGAP
ncbi:cupin domain-containing protein [Halomicroarcula limicola]|uniref:Cupin domain-containing protein n=1 Tax=Haloarcula limicola TaxID=1429915 RepID=A0A8J7Y2H1_9EURY|nr:cupin domain-containing protein [Halomicroarcula limicola]MBV0922952.1 cupin domain-containing protein [Halomicroarcula limicola]